MGYQETYQSWLDNPYFDEATKAELKAIADNEKEKEDRFYMDLEFGTAGLRGVIGAGTNRMNTYTVRRATQGLANYIIKQNGQAKGVAISYDSRRMSPEFADEAALCLAANGIKAYVFESLRPTPMLSFAVRYLHCIAGINITASHNPAEYNGYKVYWEDGAQITPPHDTGIMDEVKAVTDFANVKTMDKDAAVAAGLYEVIGAKVDDAYIAELKKQVRHQDSIDAVQKDLTIVYTPLHGTGNIPARRILKELGFENVYVVPEQELPDGNFPTVSYPNPEAAEAFELALKLAKEKDADLVLATDPDADRLGVYVKDAKTGEYITLTGNMSGCLLAEYEISQIKELNGGKLPEDGALVKTIVTTNLADAIAKNYGIRLIEVLTGFKYIGQQILGFEESGKGTYLFGFEESYGCLIGTHARDKDAIVATMALCEAAAYYKTQGKTLWDAMIDMYEKYGYYKDAVKSITLKGIEGLAKIQDIMNALRANTPAKIGEYDVLSARDYKLDTIKDMATGEVTPTGLPKSNVLYYDLNNNAWICVRPSGTEPKIKIYYGVKGASLEDADAKSAELGAKIIGMVDDLM
ncbi:MAG: phospho-sugar mutase [Lachnospiraceae bacterium]|nr:phospho-sugar mutase [Lachnospiraceae bacterium]